MFVFYFIFPLLLLAYAFREKLPAKTYYLFLAAIIYKIAAAFAMTYIQINNYDFGDLYTYFLSAKEISANLFSGDMDFSEFQRSRTIAFLNAIVFLVFPPSIYGLAVISGCSAFIYCMLMVKAAERHFDVPDIAKLLVFFLPVLSLQEGYIGKETYVLPLIGLIFFWIGDDRNVKYVPILVALAVISIIRPYQAVFIAGALILVWGLDRNQLRRLPLVAFMLVGIASVAYDEFLQMAEDLSIFGGFGDLLDVVYSGGSLVLEPYAFPFSILQSFRPFPWEAHNQFALLASFEYLAVLAYAIFRAIDKIRDPFVPWTQGQRRLGIFMFASLGVYLLVFSFDTNMGDLSRRHVYYYPILLLALSKPKRISANKSITPPAQTLGIAASRMQSGTAARVPRTD